MDRAVTWATEKDRKRDLRQRRIANAKSSIRMWWHMVKWRALHFTRLAGPYSRFMCRQGLYGTFPDGRCMWCGVIHD